MEYIELKSNPGVIIEISKGYKDALAVDSYIVRTQVEYTKYIKQVAADELAARNNWLVIKQQKQDLALKLGLTAQEAALLGL